MQKEGKKQLLNIDPKNEISFKGPYDHVVTEYFTLTNPTDSIIAFKVKTTAPKKYCVRPNNGIISSNRTVQVAVMLQPGDLTQEKHKHKFMIQSVIVPNNIDVNQIQFTVDELVCLFLFFIFGIFNLILPFFLKKNIDSLNKHHPMK